MRIVQATLLLCAASHAFAAVPMTSDVDMISEESFTDFGGGSSMGSSFNAFGSFKAHFARLEEEPATAQLLTLGSSQPVQAKTKKGDCQDTKGVWRNGACEKYMKASYGRAVCAQVHWRIKDRVTEEQKKRMMSDRLVPAVQKNAFKYCKKTCGFCDFANSPYEAQRKREHNRRAAFIKREDQIAASTKQALKKDLAKNGGCDLSCKANACHVKESASDCIECAPGLGLIVESTEGGVYRGTCTVPQEKNNLAWDVHLGGNPCQPQCYVKGVAVKEVASSQERNLICTQLCTMTTLPFKAKDVGQKSTFGYPYFQQMVAKCAIQKSSDCSEVSKARRGDTTKFSCKTKAKVFCMRVCDFKVGWSHTGNNCDASRCFRGACNQQGINFS